MWVRTYYYRLWLGHEALVQAVVAPQNVTLVRGVVAARELGVAGPMYESFGGTAVKAIVVRGSLNGRSTVCPRCYDIPWGGCVVFYVNMISRSKRSLSVVR